MVFWNYLEGLTLERFGEKYEKKLTRGFFSLDQLIVPGIYEPRNGVSAQEYQGRLISLILPEARANPMCVMIRGKFRDIWEEQNLEGKKKIESVLDFVFSCFSNCYKFYDSFILSKENEHLLMMTAGRQYYTELYKQKAQLRPGYQIVGSVLLNLKTVSVMFFSDVTTHVFCESEKSDRSSCVLQLKNTILMQPQDIIKITQCVLSACHPVVLLNNPFFAQVFRNYPDLYQQIINFDYEEELHQACVVQQGALNILVANLTEQVTILSKELVQMKNLMMKEKKERKQKKQKEELKKIPEPQEEDDDDLIIKEKKFKEYLESEEFKAELRKIEMMDEVQGMIRKSYIESRKLEEEEKTKQREEQEKNKKQGENETTKQCNLCSEPLPSNKRKHCGSPECEKTARCKYNQKFYAKKKTLDLTNVLE